MSVRATSAVAASAAVETSAADDAVAPRTLRFFQDLLRDYHPRDFAVRLWDGTEWGPEAGQTHRFTLVLTHPGAARAVLWPPDDLTAAEAYIYGDVDVEGEMEAVFPLAGYLARLPFSQSDKLRILAGLLRLPAPPRRIRPHAARQWGRLHSRRRDKAAVEHHYNVSPEFYARWLDPRMIYTCAYFRSAAETLEQAQLNKLDLVCRKLRLKPGERVLDIGCGWGGLVIHAAREYGAHVLGITLAKAQAEVANRRIHEAGLQDRARVEIRDYRDVLAAEGEASFDKLISVGMFEQVGRSKLREYFEQAYRLLKPGGAFLNHGIASHINKPIYRKVSFMTRYVFPDGELVPLGTTLDIAERVGFETRDVESLREHYVLTLRHWVRRLEAAYAAVRQVVDETTYRIWRLYMSGSAHSFETALITIYQALLVKAAPGGQAGLPLTREDWYRQRI